MNTKPQKKSAEINAKPVAGDNDKKGLQEDSLAYREIKKLLGGFGWLAFFLQGSFIVLGLISIFSSLAVATFGTDKKFENWLKPLAYTSACSSTIIGAFSLNLKAADAKTSWRLLNVALMRYQENPNSTNLDELISRYEEAEKTVGHVVFSLPQQGSHVVKTEKDELKPQPTSDKKHKDKSPTDNSEKDEKAELQRVKATQSDGNVPRIVG